MALVFPFVLLLLAVAYTGWDAMQQTIGLTSAARVGALQAANDLAAGKTCSVALTDAVSVINAEEGVSGVFTAGAISNGTSGACTGTTNGACVNNCVSITEAVAPTAATSMVTINVTRSVKTDLAFVKGISVAAHAQARWA